MVECGVYFASEQFRELIISCGGVWNDQKQRPLVCLVKSSDDDRLYWAIPMGDMAHRTEEQRSRIHSYIDLPERDIRSCYYHIARTDKESLFFISDAIPITDEYIDREYLVGGAHYTIKNSATTEALARKLFRVLAVESRNPNHFRQHITDVKARLLSDLQRT